MAHEKKKKKSCTSNTHTKRAFSHRCLRTASGDKRRYCFCPSRAWSSGFVSVVFPASDSHPVQCLSTSSTPPEGDSETETWQNKTRFNSLSWPRPARRSTAMSLLWAGTQSSYFISRSDNKIAVHVVGKGRARTKILHTKQQNIWNKFLIIDLKYFFLDKIGSESSNSLCESPWKAGFICLTVWTSDILRRCLQMSQCLKAGEWRRDRAKTVNQRAFTFWTDYSSRSRTGIQFVFPFPAFVKAKLKGYRWSKVRAGWIPYHGTSITRVFFVCFMFLLKGFP